MNLGNIVRAYRAKHSIFQSDMAKTLGCTKATLCRIEKGEHKPYGELAINILELVEPGLKQRIEAYDIESQYHLDTKGNFLNRFHKKNKVQGQRIR